MASKEPLRIGILGAAKIARLFIEGARASPRIDIRAVASRELEKAQAFARENSIAHAYGGYDALLADPAIDAVYNPLSNNLHAQWSIRAANSGKHVLCEKPLALSAKEAAAMFEAARRNNVYVVEGYPYRAQPQTQKLKELLAGGAIGKLQTVHAAFGFPLADPNNIRLNPSLGGGSLMDAGSYPVSLVRMIGGERPLRVNAMAQWHASGIDRTLVGTIDFPSGLMATVSCSFATARHRHALIIGDTGTITTTYYNDTSPQFPPLLQLSRGAGWDTRRETIETAMSNGFLAEAEEFCDLVAHGWGKWHGATPEESLDTMLMLDALAASARDGTPVDLPN